MLPGRFFALCLAGYVAGAIVTAYYLVRACGGGDLRQRGSGTLGARNASRVLGRGGALGVALVDLGKGAAVVLAARALELTPVHACLAAACTVCGHVWPPQLGWRGGKGAAIAGGALIALDPAVAAAAIAVLVLASLAARGSSVGGLAGFAAYPLIAWGWRGASATSLGQALLAALVLVAHRRDLARALTRKGATP